MQVIWKRIKLTQENKRKINILKIIILKKGRKCNTNKFKSCFIRGKKVNKVNKALTYSTQN